MKKAFLLSVLVILVSACSLSQQGSLEGETQVSTTSSIYDNAEVKLYYASSAYMVIGSAVVDRWIKGYICLENLAYNKEVIIHYSVDGGAWQQKAYGRFGYLKAAPEAGKEVWWFNLPLPHVNYKTAWTGLESEPWSAADVEFAIQYNVNGQTYWDNNGGSNYKLSTRGTDAHYNLLVLGRSIVAQEGYVEPINGREYYDKVQVAVANTGYQKSVSILYSKDDWNSSSTVTAEYNGSSADGTIDYFLADLPYNSGDCLKYAISSTVNGITTWDNNFGEDYQLGSCSQ